MTTTTTTTTTATTTAWNEIVAYLLGRKYYANIIRTKGVAGMEMSSFIFADKRDAECHRRELRGTRLYRWVETVGFRSRRVPVGICKAYSEAQRRKAREEWGDEE